MHGVGYSTKHTYVAFHVFKILHVGLFLFENLLDEFKALAGPFFADNRAEDFEHLGLQLVV